MARRLAVLCSALAPLLLFLGLVAGFVNHHLVDGQRFAEHVDAMRKDPAVAHQLGEAMTRTIINGHPDLIAVQPLVEATTTSLAASPVFSPVVTTTTRQVHRYFTDPNSDQLAVTLADIGSVLSGVLTAVSPQAAATIPPGLDVTLGEVGSQSFAAETIRLTHLVGVLSWLLPLLALVLFAAGVALDRDRLRMVFWAGWGVAAAGGGIGLLWVACALNASSQDTSSLNGALVSAGWDQLSGSLARLAVLTSATGAFLAAAASGRVPDLDIGGVTNWAWSRVATRPVGAWAGAWRGVALVLAGLAFVLRPSIMATLLALVLGWVLLLSGAGELATLAGARRAMAPGSGARRHPWAPILVLSVAAALVIAVMGYQALPVDQRIGPAAMASRTGCNGYVALCDRPYNEVAYVAGHNAMSASDAGWYLPEQPTGLVGALDDGVRALLIDTWYGQPTDRPRRVLTAERSYQGAIKEARAAFGDDAVASALRLRSLYGKPTGPPKPYMCHGLCETGGTPLEPTLVQVRSWLQANPRAVVTFVIEDNVTPDDTVAAFQAAGLMPYIHTQVHGHPWPTLGEMIDSGRRLVVMMERHGGGSEAPWLLSAFDWMQDTAYTNPTVADLNCELKRGEPSSPLFMINNWLSSFTGLISNARKVNAYGQLWPYVERCQRQRGRLPNFIAVNWYDKGDVFRVVDQLNGVG